MAPSLWISQYYLFTTQKIIKAPQISMEKRKNFEVLVLLIYMGKNMTFALELNFFFLN
jgi:hypothetical protein